MYPDDLSHTNGHAYRGMPTSSRGEPFSSSEDGTGSSRGRQRPTSDARTKEHAMWPNPWMRKHWDPDHPLDLNNTTHVEDAPLGSDELEARTFEPAFAMDLNELVQSLWTPPKLPPPPSPSMRSREDPRNTRHLSSLRRQRSGSPSPPHPSLQSFDTRSAMRDGPRHAPTAEEYEFRSRRMEQPIDPRMSSVMDSCSRPAMGRRDLDGGDEQRSRRAASPRYMDSEYPSSRRQPPPMYDYDQPQHPPFSSRRRMPPQYDTYDPRYTNGRGYHSDDNVLPRQRTPEYQESQDSAGTRNDRRDVYSMDAQEAARDAEAAAMARLALENMDGRSGPRAGPQLRRVVSAPPEQLQQHLRRAGRSYERRHYDERSGGPPAPFLSAHPGTIQQHHQHQQHQHQQQHRVAPTPTTTQAPTHRSINYEEEGVEF